MSATYSDSLSNMEETTKGRKCVCLPGCHVHIIDWIAAGADKYLWLLQSYLSQEYMPIVTFPPKDKSQMLVGVSGFFLSSRKEAL